ncbi:hypothetical protein, partial [Burkholderia sp. Ac-20345]|uniref:hypothetical protein n=1 Tax=Burkholderia sp. Ac-20345 TaxID=2703891 RepID=UPI00197BA58B
MAGSGRNSPAIRAKVAAGSGRPVCTGGRRDAPSRVDEARPYYPPNEDVETEGWRHAMVLPW